VVGPAAEGGDATGERERERGGEEKKERREMRMKGPGERYAPKGTSLAGALVSHRGAASVATCAPRVPS
jgi:hypothetical protein